jgi:hypothetical protein
MDDSQTSDNLVVRTQDPLTAPLVAPAQRSCAGSLSPAQSTSEARLPSPSFVYVIGRIEHRFPNLSVEKEIAQAISHAGDTAGLTSQQAVQKVLVNNRYLVRQLCWVLTVQGVETYLLVPRDPGDYSLLAEAVRPSPSPNDLDVVIGILGPIAPADMCNGLMLPIVLFDQVYSFDRTSLISSIPHPSRHEHPTRFEMDAAQFTTAAGEVFDRIVSQSDNAGATDEHRALNYLAVRSRDLYATAARANLQNASLTAFEVKPSSLSGTRNIVDVVSSYTDRNSGVVTKYFTRVDVSGEFPFLVSPTAPYYDRP